MSNCPWSAGRSLVVALVLSLVAATCARAASKDSDFNGDGKADIVWYNGSTGTTSAWLMNGTAIAGSAGLLTDPNWKVVATADFNGDGKSDILWYNAATGTTTIWLMNGTAVVGSATVLSDANWKPLATADFDGDGKSDILWYNATTGTTALWLMNGTAYTTAASILTDGDWKVLFTADFNGDGKADLLWYNASSGTTAIWLMNGTALAGSAGVLTDLNWKVAATADFDADGKADLLWYNASSGTTAVWLMNGTAIAGSGAILTDLDWKVTHTADFNGDGRADIVWYNASTRTTAIWLMSGTANIGAAGILTDPAWRVTATPDFNGDGKADLLWYNPATGTTSTWLMSGTALLSSAGLLYDPDWAAKTDAALVPQSVIGTTGQLAFGIAADANGNLLIGTATTATIPRPFYGVQRVDVGAVVGNLAGGDTVGIADGARTAARFGYLRGVAVGPDGSTYVADGTYSTVRKISPDGVVTTLAGSGSLPGAFVDGTGSAARFLQPYGIAVDASGTVYVADSGNNAIRKVSPTGVVTTLAGGGGGGPHDTAPGYVNGGSTVARFNDPLGVAVDASGNVYVADYGNHAIRKIAPNGDVSTVAGGGPGASGFQNGTGTAARFSNPTGVAIDGSGQLYVLDAGNLAIRKVSATAVVSTLAGSGTEGSLDGAGSTARFTSPFGLSVDKFGSVYVTDAVASGSGGPSTPSIRKIFRSGIVSTLMH